MEVFNIPLPSERLESYSFEIPGIQRINCKCNKLAFWMLNPKKPSFIRFKANLNLSTFATVVFKVQCDSGALYHDNLLLFIIPVWICLKYSSSISAFLSFSFNLLDSQLFMLVSNFKEKNHQSWSLGAMFYIRSKWALRRSTISPLCWRLRTQGFIIKTRTALSKLGQWVILALFYYWQRSVYSFSCGEILQECPTKCFVLTFLYIWQWLV